MMLLGISKHALHEFKIESEVIKITTENVGHLLPIGKIFGINNLTESCTQFLINHKEHCDVLDILVFAKKYRLTDLAKEFLAIAMSQNKLSSINKSAEANEWRELIANLQKNKIEIREFFDDHGLYVHMQDASQTSSWECLEKLNGLIPITKLQLNKTNLQNFEPLLNLVHKNPNITQLYMGDSSEIEDYHLNQLSQHLQHLNVFSIENAKITFIPECITKSVKKLICRDCTNLTHLIANAAEELNCKGCSALITLNANAVNVLDCRGFIYLTHLSVETVQELDCEGCIRLSSVIANKAKKLDCSDCTALTNLSADIAKELYCRGCIALTNLIVNNAKVLLCNGCTSLTTITANTVKELYCNNCIVLTNLIAHTAKKLYCRGCIALTTLSANAAKELNCNGCISLTSLAANAAKELNCNGCIALTTLSADAVLVLDCRGLIRLKSLFANAAIELNCRDLTHLTTLSANAAKELNFYGCIALTTLSAEAVLMLDCRGLIHLKSLYANAATRIECECCTALEILIINSAKMGGFHDCISLTTISINAAESFYFNNFKNLTSLTANAATQIECKGCTALKTLNAKAATYLNFSGCSALEIIRAPDPIITSIKPEEFPCLIFSREQHLLRESHRKLCETQQRLCEFLQNYEIDPTSYLLGKGIGIPEVPRLELQQKENLGADNIKIVSDELINELDGMVEEVNFKNETAPFYADENHIKVGGKLYTKDDLLQGLSKLREKLPSDDVHEDIKNRIRFWIGELVPGWLDKDDEIDPSIALIRLLVSTLKSDNGLVRVEDDLQLMYQNDQLYAALKQINTTDKGKEGYIDPETIMDDKDVKVSVANLRKSLITLFSRVKCQKMFVGTPPEGNSLQLQLFYQNLEKYLQLIAINLESMKDPEEKGRHLIDLAIAARHCGERWIGDSEQIYELSLPEEQRRFISLPDIIHAHDSNLRIGIIEEIMGKSRDVHLYDLYKRLIGMKFGLRGAESVAGLADINAEHYYLTEEIASDNFLKKYTLLRVVKYHQNNLYSLFKRSRTRGLTVNFLKDIMADDWDTEDNKYAALKETVINMESQGKNRTEIREVIKNDIYCGPDWSAQKAVSAHIQKIESERDDKIVESDPDNEDEEQQIRQHYEPQIAKVWKLFEGIKEQTVEEQKNSLRENHIEIGNDSNPNFLDEIEKERKEVYLESLFEKDKYDKPTELTLDAVIQVLHKVGKIRPK